ncbi:MAG: hypothetical protein QNI90_14105 [Dinoroseobacter sp.]|nr:hypothetical protein [Dinoroseobacter sp.]
MIDDLLAEFFKKSTGMVYALPSGLGTASLEDFSETVEAELLRSQSEHLRSTRLHRLFSPQLSKRKLREPLRRFCREILREDFQHFVDSKLEITPSEDILREGRKPYFIKINHGFWEQILSSGWEQKPKNIGRPVSAEHYSKIYFETCFVPALLEAMQGSATVVDGKLLFDQIDFGFSLNNGMLPHREILQNFPDLTDEDRVVGRGAMVGLLAFAERGLSASRFTFVDGGFPKRSFLSGDLAAWVEQAPQGFDRIVYVVPPHLGRIRTASANAIPQTVYQISGRQLLLSWMPTLALVARGINDKLLLGERLLVVTQSAVFSALLGTILHQIAREFDASDPPVSFLDLGQVLDMAHPESAASWVQVYQPDPTLSPFKVEDSS